MNRATRIRDPVQIESIMKTSPIPLTSPIINDVLPSIGKFYFAGELVPKLGLLCIALVLFQIRNPIHVTKTKGKVEFDEIDYCMNIQSLLFGTPTNIAGVHQNFSVFPKLVPSEVLSMPMEVNTNTILYYYQNQV